MQRIADHLFSNRVRYRPGDDAAQIHLTPGYVLDPVREALGGVITLDPCTTADNPVEAVRFYCPPADGLAEPWDAPTIFVNPPYGKAREPWVNRCVGAALNGSRVVLLMPAATDTAVFQRAAACASVVVMIRGRLKFGIWRENTQAAATHPSALFGWGTDLAPCWRLGLPLVAQPAQRLLFLRY